LGKPLEIGGGVLERQDILQNCFHQYHPTEEKYDGKSSYYMGIDQGNELQLVVGKISPNSNKMKIVHIEVVPFEEGFDKVGKLMNQYNVKLGVIDADPNRHSAMKVVENFPAKLLAADYSSNAKTRITVKKNKRGIRSRVNLGRTFSFDHLYDTIFKGFFSLPGHADSMLPEVDKLIQQVVSIRRDVVEKNRQEGSLDVGVWRALGPDHFAHALVYLKTAYDIDNTGARFRFHIIGEEGEEEEEIDAETAEDEEVYSFNPDGDSDEDEPPKKTTRIRII
jgi:hypothetical protein